MHSLHYFKRAVSSLGNQSVTASPYVYTNSSKDKQQCTVSGGTVSKIEGNNGSGYVTLSGTSGAYTVFPNENLRITYSVIPTLSVVQH